MTEIIVTGVIGVLTVTVSYMVARQQRGKLQAEADESEASATETITDTALKLIKPLQDRIDRQDRRIKELRAQANKNRERIIHLEQGVAILRAQVIELGGEPQWPSPI